MRRTHDLADLAHEATDALEHLLAFERVRLDDRPLALVELAGLVDDLLRHRDLADVVQQCPELDVAPFIGVQPQLPGDIERQAHHALAVLPGIAVVGLDHVAKQQRGPLVCVVELDQLLQAGTALLGELPQNPEQRCDQQHRPLTLHWRCGERDGQPERGQRQVDGIDLTNLSNELAQRDVVQEALPHGVGGEVADELRAQRKQQDAPVPVRIAVVREQQHDRRPQREPAVAGHRQYAADRHLPAQDSRRHPQRQRKRHQQRHERDRHGEQHRHEHGLCRHRKAPAPADIEPNLTCHGDAQHIQRGDRQRKALLHAADHGKRDGHDDEAGADEELLPALVGEHPLRAGGE